MPDKDKPNRPPTDPRGSGKPRPPVPNDKPGPNKPPTPPHR